MKLHHCISIFVLSILFSGCVASGLKGLQELEPKPGKGVLYVFRESKFAASGVNTRIEIDGKPLGTLPNGSYLVTYLSPGAHTVSAKFSLLNKMYYRDCEIVVKVGEGEIKTAELQIEMTSLTIGGAGSHTTWENGLVEIAYERARAIISQLRINNTEFDH